MNPEANQRVAHEFFRLGRLGDRAGIEALVTPNARHHNPHFRAGMSALFDGMMAAATTAPDREMQIKRVLADGDYVITHSHVRQKPGDNGAAVVHIFRFEAGRIAELWDLAQPVPAENPNSDGMF